MKTKVLLSAIIALMLSAGIYASEPIILKNEKTTEFGKQIEQTILVEGTDYMPDKRILRNFDHEGRLIEKTTYKWVMYIGWKPLKKLVYDYDLNNDLATVSSTVWNGDTNKWNTESEIMSYDTWIDRSVLFATKDVKE